MQTWRNIYLNTDIFKIDLLFIVRSLHEVHEMNAYRADCVCPSVRPSTCLNSETAGRILIKFDTDVMPLDSTPDSYLLIFYNR
jgi:hypothetical protein